MTEKERLTKVLTDLIDDVNTRQKETTNGLMAPSWSVWMKLHSQPPSVMKSCPGKRTESVASTAESWPPCWIMSVV